MGSRELLTQLRKRLGDERYIVPAFTIKALCPMATDAELEIRNGRFRTELANAHSDMRELNIDLVGMAQYDTLGKLVAEIKLRYSRQYDVEIASGMQDDHPSADLEEIRIDQIHKSGVTLRTHRWSDEELLRFVLSGSRRHNPSYTADTLPPGEQDMVLALAQIEALRALANDAARRRGIEGTSQDLLATADALEVAYNADVRRLAKALVPVRTDDDGVREGDVVVGEFSRRSPRTGASASGVANLQPQPPLLYEPDEGDISDFAIVVRWRRTRETSVYALELWRDTQPDVRRSRNLDIYPSTAVRVWSSRTGATTGQDGWGPTQDLAGELVPHALDGYVVPPVGVAISEVPNALEPGTTYWYRLYIVDRSGEWTASDVVSGTTKSARALFSRTTTPLAMSINTGLRAGGEAVTIRGTGFTANSPITVTVGSKLATSVVVVDDTTITFVAPGVHAWTPEYQDVVLTSSSGLRDVYPRGWLYT